MNKRILVVDDLRDNRYLLRALLEGHGYAVSEASNGAQALASARTEPPDAVVTDLLMPEMDGFALCREWGNDETLGRIPIVVYSATYTAPEDRELVLDLGAAAFVIKPAEPEAITETIRDAIERAAAPVSSERRVSDEDFYARYSSRLEAKLDRKIDQLGATRLLLEDYVARCEAILDASADAIVALDADAKIRTWNYSAERLFGYTEVEALGKPVDILVPADRQAEARRMLMEVKDRQGRVKYETQRRRKDGARLDVAISLSYLGPRIGVVSVISDLTAIRRAAAEKRQLEKKLAIAQRMEAVGRLAGGVAHDFNNLLTVVLSYAELIEEGEDSTEAHRETARQIREAGEVAASLTRQLLSFGRQQSNVPQVLDLNGAIHGMGQILRRLLGEHVELVLHLDPDLGRIEADPSQVEQVLLNLVVNARDAMPDGGRLTLETRNETREQGAQSRGIVPGPSGSYVVMTVIDTGVGMDAKTRAQAFDPFFTTKALGKGTGLGLATVHDIVAQSGGHIRVDSEPGRGATFTISWPREERPPSAAKTDSTLMPAHGERVLLVDDQRAVRQVARRVLTRAGYRVIEAASGEEAEREAERLDQSVDLLITDLRLPKLDGQELAGRLGTRWPALRVLYTSSWFGDLDTENDHRISTLTKPFTTIELVAAVRAALDCE